MTSRIFAGLRTTPLASYLAGIGLVRVLAEQVDPHLTAAWQGDGLALDTTVEDIPSWLVDQYAPTPVLTPWNKGSGFGAGDVNPRERLTRLAELPSPRFDLFRQAYRVAVQVGEQFQQQGGKDEAKARAVREFRNRCPEPLLPWIDASVVIGNDQLYYPPLLGTGGNDGRLDFSTKYHEGLLEVLDVTDADRLRSLTLAEDLLTGSQRERLHDTTLGQFDPASAGGKGSSPFDSTEALANPWLVVLMVEGALLFAASAARRHLHGARRAAMPFTVQDAPYGSGSGAHGEESRGEVWAPVWERPFSYSEIQQLFTEARAAWRGRPAQRAADFLAATRTLGVVRGVSGFVRYALHQRNGLSHVAVPVERIRVEEKPAVQLAGKVEDWVSWVRRGDASTGVRQAVRRFDDAHFRFVRHGDAPSLLLMLATLTDLELVVGRSGRAREAVPVRKPPSAAPFLKLLAQDPSPELRIAVGLASGVAHTGSTAWSLRELLLPVGRTGWRNPSLVSGFGTRPLLQVLAEVLIWRSRTAAGERDEPAQDKPAVRGVLTFRGGVPVPPEDLHALAAGQVDLAHLEQAVRACLALRWDGIRHPWPSADHPVPMVPTLALLHALAAGLTAGQPGPDTPLIGMAPDWARRLAAGQVNAVHQDAVRRLRQVGWHAVDPPPIPTATGVAIAAALLPPCQQPVRMLSRVALQIVPIEESDLEEKV